MDERSPAPPADGAFVHVPLAAGLDLHVHPTDRFKTVTLQVVLHGELGPETTLLALLPSVLRRGTRLHPTLQDVTRHLDHLYGASLDADVSKRGEAHLLTLRLSLPAPAFVPEGEALLDEALSFLAQILSDPPPHAEGFAPDVVEQEKANLGHTIRALVNYREQYAFERMVQIMCDGERFSRYEYGDLAELETITPAGLHAFWRSTLDRRPLTLLAVGPLDPAVLADRVAAAFDWPRDRVTPPAPAERRLAPPAPRLVEEPFPLEQEWIAQGYRIGTPLEAAHVPALLFFNGLLGGFPFSRLFKNVREEAGLAYAIGSHTERFKGILAVTAGVKPGSSAEALRRIADALASLAEGRIGAEEMEAARNILLTEIRSVPDSPGALIHGALDGVLEGRVITLAQIEAGIRTVTARDVASLAAATVLDTTFILRPATRKDPS